ncbi:MAG TPA: hypothetical protein PLG16_05970 [Planctomycetota bacterium]|nr:hypothetical protein [Planctomycetota bacterium]
MLGGGKYCTEELHGGIRLLWGGARIKVKRLALFFYAKFLIYCCFSYF